MLSLPDPLSDRRSALAVGGDRPLAPVLATSVEAAWEAQSQPMKIAILKERRIAETRVAATPDSIKRLRSLGCSVAIESGAGLAAGVSDQHYRDAGAEVAGDPAATLAGAQALFAVQRPMGAGDAGPDIVSMLRPGSALVGLLAPYADRKALDAYARGGIAAFAMELVPRISRAQSMDALSSQASLAGYRAVIDAVGELGRAVPMMMTAAGTIAPAKVFVLGAGVAGLQAIATARRLGAVVCATDVRPAAKEQVESLGARFVWLEDAEASASETKGGYAKAMSPDYLRRQVALVAETLRQQDIVICTAMIPGSRRPAW